MTKEEGLELLKSAPTGSELSRINKGISLDQAKGIVYDALVAHKDGEVLQNIIEKRVWQITKNRKRPKEAAHL